MTFASSVVNGVFFDIRYVIMFFGLVFGGIQTGLLLLLEFIIYRLYLGGEGTWVAVLIIAFTFTFSLFFHNIYRTTLRKSLVTEHLAFHIVVIPVQNSIGIWLLMSLFSKSVSDKEIFIKHAQNEKMEAMSHMAASLAHEVRNPLTAVKGFLVLIREKPQELQKVRQYIDISLDEIQRTESIITEYLSIAKPPAERHGIINFSEQVQIIMEVMTPYANMYNVQLDVHRLETPLLILANPDEMKQVLVNFIKNAVEACSEVTNGQVILTLHAEEHYAKLSIKDNGIGMSEDQ